jgi:hypothetical protein
MNAFEKFVEILSMEMPTKQAAFGWFHLLTLAITILVTVIICAKYKNCDDRTFRKVLFVIWLTLIGFEIYKQLVSPYSFTAGMATWKYNLNDIPYQFCSSIHYVLPVIIFFKAGKVRDAFIGFAVTFMFLAGFVVMLYPDQLKDDRAIGICIQTMWHHGAQVVAGAFIAIRERKKLSHKLLLSGALVYGGFLALALILNVALNPSVIGGETINFFYISPYHGCSLPVLKDIRLALSFLGFFGWLIFFIIYLVAFCGASYLIGYLFMLATKKIR